MSSNFENLDVASPDFEEALGDVTFVSNAAVYFLLSSLKASQQNQTQPEVFESALEYTKRFHGAVAPDATAIDELTASLSNWETVRELDDGSTERIHLTEYEKVALMNLNPVNSDAAQSLIPSLDRFLNSEIDDILQLISAASARYGGISTTNVM